MGYTEVNTACDLCNCYWGSPGNRACDVELTRKYLRPRIPTDCPKGLQPAELGLKPLKTRHSRFRGIPTHIHPSRIREAVA